MDATSASNLAATSTSSQVLGDEIDGESIASSFLDLHGDSVFNLETF